MWAHRRFLSIFVALALAMPASARDPAPATGHVTGVSTGPVTNLPMPRFVSMKASEGNVRRGPSLTHRIDWVFQRRDMPLRITAEHGHWRRVEDRDGLGGWVHYSLLSGTRSGQRIGQNGRVHGRPGRIYGFIHIDAPTWAICCDGSLKS